MSEPSGTTWKRKMTLLCDEDPIGGGKQTFSGMGNKENNVFFVFCRFEDSAAYLWVGQSVVFFCGEG